MVGILIAVFTFTFVQQFLYPEAHQDRHTKTILQQFASIKQFDASSLRLDAWQWSWELIKEKPIFGVGIGNWKINILKHENQQNSGFIYMCKAHNDFLETVAETGAFGGLLFLGLFAAILWNFLRYYYLWKKNDPDNLLKYLFLAAAGVSFYSVDASFNFPADRPEVLLLFALFIAIGISSAFRQKREIRNYAYETEKVLFANIGINKIASFLAIVLLFLSAWILYLNFQSSKTQRIVYQEIKAGFLKEKSEKIISGFPFIPNISIWGESISTLKARYLINEGKNQEAIELLRTEDLNPYDARREFFMAMAFNNLKDYDNALFYSETAVKLKPNYFENLYLVVSILEKKGDYERASAYCDAYLKTNKNNIQAWLITSNLHIQNKNFDKATRIINEALKNFPQDKNLFQQQQNLNHKLNIEPNSAIFKQVNDYFQKQRYSQAIPVLDKFLEKAPDNAYAYEIHSFSLELNLQLY